MRKPRSWSERHRHRHDWALQAYDRFVHELAPEVSVQLERSDQVTVVVYGATQVGKTTLILELLGLVSDTREEIANVLRGGQEQGNSATVMPLRYGRSNDDHWRIGDSGPLDPAQATCMLAGIRRGVEQGAGQDMVLTDILIPGRLFPLAGDTALDVDVKLIDLPGLDARNAHERELVTRLARRFVTVADLVLLVTQATSLGFLGAESLKIEELASWVHQPVRFRVVITSGYSLSSVRRSLLADVHPDVSAVRSTMIEEINSLDLQIPASFSHNVYVLELGDSARDMATVDPGYFSLVRPLVETFRSQLISDIKRSCGPLSRVFAAFQLDQVVMGQIAAFEEDHQARKALQRAELQELESQLYKRHRISREQNIPKAMREIRSRLEAEIQASREWLHMLGLLEQSDSLSIIGSLFKTVRVSNVEQRVSRLQDTLHCIKGKVRAQSETWVGALKELLCKNLSTTLQEHVDDLFSLLRPLAFDERDFLALECDLDQYSMDRYVRSSSYEHDRDLLIHAFSQSRKRHVERARAQFVIAVQQQVRIHTKRLPASRLELQQLRKDWTAHQACRKGMTALGTALRGNIARMRESQETARHFERLVDEGFSQALHAATTEITSGHTATEKFLGLMNAHLIINEADRFYSGIPAS